MIKFIANRIGKEVWFIDEFFLGGIELNPKIGILEQGEIAQKSHKARCLALGEGRVSHLHSSGFSFVHFAGAENPGKGSPRIHKEVATLGPGTGHKLCDTFVLALPHLFLFYSIDCYI